MAAAYKFTARLCTCVVHGRGSSANGARPGELTFLGTCLLPSQLSWAKVTEYTVVMDTIVSRSNFQPRCLEPKTCGWLEPIAFRVGADPKVPVDQKR